jgi:hypothetical protein
MIPSVHIGGTSINELERQLNEAVNALDAACAALIGAEPNGRDYVPILGPEAFSRAQQQHRDRLRRVRSVREELAEIWEGLPSNLT